MHFFHKNKSQPSLPEIYEAGGEDDGVQQGVNARLPVRYSLVIPSTQSPQSLYAYANDQPAQQHQQQQSQPQQLQHYEDSYTHPAHAVSRFSDERSDSPPTLSQQQAGKPVLNLVPTSPTLALGSASDLSSNEHPYTPQSPEPVPLVEAPQPRKLRKGLFGLSSKDKNKDKEKDASFRSSKVLGRSISVRRKAGQTFPEHRKSNGQPFDSAADSKAEQTTENRMPLHSKKSPQPPAPPYASTLNHSSSNIESQLFEPSRIQRVSTEPLSQESYPQRQSQAQLYPDGFQHPAVLHPKLQIDQAGPWQPGTQYHFGGSQAFADEPSNSRSQSPQLDPHLTPRPPSQQSFGPPSPLNPHYQGFESNQHKFHFRQSLQPPTGPAVPLNQSGMERQTGLRQPSETAPPGQISQSQTIQPPNLTPGNSFKSGLGQSGSKEPDRDTPPPPPAKGRDDTDIDVRALNQKYEELQAKYIKVKRYYFDKEKQVQDLQNTVAHQRMSTSRTVLDDNEYATRFARLDGAINNLAFNIRKDWKSVPPWLQNYVNEDAHAVGTKEMTAVGRACLTRWLVDEIFDRYFHPSLEPNLSRNLKLIERNVRRMGKAVTEEEKENHLAKLSSWRRTTLDGVGEALTGKLAEDHRVHLTKTLVEKLTASLEMNLKDPAPPGLENGVSMIVELAVGIAANIPLESREVMVEYYLPGAPIVESHMKLETTLPPLNNLPSESRLSSEPSSAVTDRGDQGSLKETNLDGNLADSDGAKDISTPASTNANYPPVKEGRKKSVFGSLISKKPHPSTTTSPSEPARPSSAILREAKEREEVDKDEPMRIRFAAFVAVEVRGKGTTNVIVKTPVYGLVSKGSEGV